MKKLVGQRKIVDTELKGVIALVETLACGNARPLVVTFPDTACAACKKPLVIILREDAPSGQIWIEGPDACAECGHPLLENQTAVPPLSQDYIENVFGKY